MKNTTLLFLVKKNAAGDITHLCLAMKKRGFGEGRWNGVGGKVAENESVEGAARRETREEIGVEVSDLTKVAELAFTFPHNISWNQLTHVFTAEQWKGEPTESEEMKPQWYSVDSLPFDNMWPDDPFWLPKIIERKLIRGAFSFAEESAGNAILEKKVEEVAAF